MNTKISIYRKSEKTVPYLGNDIMYLVCFIYKNYMDSKSIFLSDQ